MGFLSSVADGSVHHRAVILFSLIFLVGCQVPQPGLGNRLAAHVAMIDQSGLTDDEAVASEKVQAAIPRGWDPMAHSSTPLYEHQQWRSPTKMTGVGVLYIHMPLPMSAKTLVWLARTQYSKKVAVDHEADAKVMGEWTDSLGREWFEGENDKYHVKGYVVTNGMDAWAVYSGYRLHGTKPLKEIALGYRSMDSIVPLPLLKHSEEKRK